MPEPGGRRGRREWGRDKNGAKTEEEKGRRKLQIREKSRNRVMDRSEEDRVMK